MLTELSNLTTAARHRSQLTFDPFAIEERLRRRLIRSSLHLAPLNTFEVKRLVDGLGVEQVLHDQEVGLRLDRAAFQVSDFNGVEA